MVVFLLATLFFTSLWPKVSAQEELPSQINEAQKAVAIVKTYNDKGKVLKVGSGFFLNQSGDLLTDRRLLVGASSVEVSMADGTTYPVNTVKADDIYSDLILMTVEAPTETIFLPITDGRLEYGKEVYVIGGAFALKDTYFKGRIKSVTNLPFFGEVGEFDLLLSSLWNGGPVVNTQGTGRCSSLSI